MPNATMEKEAKMMLQKEEFEKLLSLRDFSFIHQVNDFYLTKDGKAFRFREIEGQPMTFTHKRKVKDGHLEFEKEVDSKSLEDPYILEVLGDIKGVKHLGILVTDRYLFTGEKGEICLDHSYYLEKDDYEFEYEVYNPEENYEEGIAFLKEAGIHYKENTKGKFRRFLEAMNA